ncbi:unnamed protein product [Phytomonas sp. EM1]|nr:unnamed protein product [Phytomonas sp. EM1]|eukprot:CCW63869.1 unnamed protein product [Phytomonas sp. isolate EM1]
MRTLKESQSTGSPSGGEEAAIARDGGCGEASTPSPASSCEDAPQTPIKPPELASGGVKDEHLTFFTEGEASCEAASASSRTISSSHTVDLRSLAGNTAAESPGAERSRTLHEISRASEVTKSRTDCSVVIHSRKSNRSLDRSIDGEFSDAEESKLIALLQNQLRNTVELPSRRLYARSPLRSDGFSTEHPIARASFSSPMPFEKAGEEGGAAGFLGSCASKQPLCRETLRDRRSPLRNERPGIKVKPLDPRNYAEWDLKLAEGDAPAAMRNSPKMVFSPLSIDKTSSDVNNHDPAPDSTSSASKKPTTTPENVINHRRARRKSALPLFPPSPGPSRSRTTTDAKNEKNNAAISSLDDNNSSCRDSYQAASSFVSVAAGASDDPYFSHEKSVYVEKKAPNRWSNAPLTSEVVASFERIPALRSPRLAPLNIRGLMNSHSSFMTSSNKSLEGRTTGYDTASAQLAETDASSYNELDLMQDTSTGSA